MSTPTQADRERAREVVSEVHSRDPGDPGYLPWEVDMVAQALADERARNVARLREMAKGHDGDAAQAHRRHDPRLAAVLDDAAHQLRRAANALEADS